MKNKKTTNKLESYGVGASIIALINKKSDILPQDINWIELGHLYFYAEHLREALKPWINKMQQHFIDNDKESFIVVALARHQNELEQLVLNEIVYIKNALSLHDFRTLLKLFPKLDTQNKKLALQAMKHDIGKQTKSEFKLYCLGNYYHLCTAKKEKTAILDQIIQESSDLKDFELRDIYKKFPDQRIADLWFTSLKNTHDFSYLVDAAIITKQDAFFERAKIENIIGVASDICRMMRDKYKECEDERLLDIWLHVITVFHRTGGDNMITPIIEAYQTTQDLRFFDFGKQNINQFRQKLMLYKLIPDTEILVDLKILCSSFIEAKEGLAVTGDPYFFEQAKKYINEKIEYGVAYIFELYKELMEDPDKHKGNLKNIKNFIKENMEGFWNNCTNSHDKHKFLKLLS